MNDIVITSAARTPIGSFLGALSSVPAHQLGATAISAAMERSQLKADDIDEVLLGQVLTAGAGQNTARQAAMAAGIPYSSTAVTVNQVCGSGLRTVAMAYQAIKSGDSQIVVAGGQENMSLSPHCASLRGGHKMGNANFVDTMIKDGLWDAFHDYHMGTTAENVAERFEVSRAAQDAFAAASQQKAEAAQLAGNFKNEITPVTVKSRRGDIVVDVDEYIKPGTTEESLAKLRTAFSKEGTVTAGNASGLNDGAAALVLMSSSEASKRKLPTMAPISIGEGRMAGVGS